MRSQFFDRLFHFCNEIFFCQWLKILFKVKFISFSTDSKQSENMCLLFDSQNWTDFTENKFSLHSHRGWNKKSSRTVFRHCSTVSANHRAFHQKRENLASVKLSLLFFQDNQFCSWSVTTFIDNLENSRTKNKQTSLFFSIYSWNRKITIIQINHGHICILCSSP